MNITINQSSPIPKFPGYFTTQIHPEEDQAVADLAKINTQFEKANDS